jgi:hypothetical protein
MVAASPDKSSVRGANVRTALILLSIALVFFFGIIFAKFVGDSSTGMAVIGFAILLFLVVTIGRNLWNKKK